MMTLITNKDYEKMKGQEHTLIDVLPKEHFEQFHLDNAINICVYETSFQNKINALGLDNKHALVVYGESDNEYDSNTAADKLENMGFSNIYVLEAQCSNLDTDQLLKIGDGVYTLVENSMLHWTGSNANGSHFGQISCKQGHIEVEETQISGEFIVDMCSINTLNLDESQGALQLNEHLQSDDFFFSKFYPEAKFSFENITSVDIPYQTNINYVLDGELTIRNISRKQKVDALMTSTGNKLFLHAKVQIDKTDWGIIYGSSKYFKFLGMHKIFDLISIEMRLEFQK
jgi:polyisoprenoid-binding protein YceI